MKPSTIILLFLAFISVIIFVVYYELNLSETGIKRNKNEANIKKVKIGMSEKNMIKIMGKPDTVIFFNGDLEPRKIISMKE